MELKLSLAELSSEYVLVQAFKKTVSYIRYHNWFADSIELDKASADLPNFLENLAKNIMSGRWEASPLHLVMAPKSHEWHWTEEEGWWPAKGQEVKLRPIAHVSLEDQVLATAIMLCLANRVETLQGDPRKSISGEKSRNVRSYGNRLYCDVDETTGELQHRWASQKLYRAYFQDYQAFVARPDLLASEQSTKEGGAFVTQSDLAQFYDRVRPHHLSKAIRSLVKPEDEASFFDLCDQVFNWRWYPKDQKAVERYCQRNELASMEAVALPQGLVASGFFANIVLLDFDNQIAGSIGKSIIPGFDLIDYCRYVDDIRLVWRASPEMEADDINHLVSWWLSQEIEKATPFLRISSEKTETAQFGGDQNHLVRVSRKMHRIQRGLSGGFDASGGKDIMQAIEALVKSQASITARESRDLVEPFQVIPDVKSETVNRFAAGRFRSAYRSLRVLLPDEDPIRISSDQTRADLDEDAHSFALDLINAWKDNPANVRLLRIGLDLWPSVQILDQLFEMLIPCIDGTVTARDPKKVAHYCLSEIFRAGATETGFTSDPDSLPSAIDLKAYRNRLLEFAILIDEAASCPWYLKQQALLFIATQKPTYTPFSNVSRRSLRSHIDLINFLSNPQTEEKPEKFAVLAIVAHRSFPSHRSSLIEAFAHLSKAKFDQIAERDIEFAREIYRRWSQNLLPQEPFSNSEAFDEIADGLQFLSLRSVVGKDKKLNRLRNEIGVLSFATKFCERYMREAPTFPLTPSDVDLQIEAVGQYGKVVAVDFASRATAESYRQLYSVPGWAKGRVEWRLRLGYLLRYVLTARLDFSVSGTPAEWRDELEIYEPTRGHWLLRQYGFYNGHEAFGDDWLPISQDVQEILFSLLRWPGCRQVGLDLDQVGLEGFKLYAETLLKQRLDDVGKATQTLFLKIDAPNPAGQGEGRPLRGCVVQSVLPQVSDFKLNDLELDGSAIRRRHRNHLTTALAAVNKMLELRETHQESQGRLDWLIFPELAVHPKDVDQYLVPFARARRTAILAGLTYQNLVPGDPLVNSAIWILPVVTPTEGLQIVKLRQCKKNLASLEQGFLPHVHGFRPCQWLVGYHWSGSPEAAPLWLTGSICYDATDLGLAADLRNRSDIFAIPALNQDVSTFDNMALALHYHMYQPVIIANNGAYGGSNKYTPKGNGSFKRQVFHTHGQPQATISFFEVEEIDDLKQRKSKGLNKAGDWKYPPAGL